MSWEIACPKCGRIYSRCREALNGPYCECPPQPIAYSSDTAMTTTNTPLTDAKVAEMIKLNQSPEGLEFFARTLETRLHAAEKLLRESQAAFIEVYSLPEAGAKASFTPFHYACYIAEAKAARIAAHLASAANPASATTTRETTQ